MHRPPRVPQGHAGASDRASMPRVVPSAPGGSADVLLGQGAGMPRHMRLVDGQSATGLVLAMMGAALAPMGVASQKRVAAGTLPVPVTAA